MDVKSRKAEQSEATRGALVGAARALFTERGFAGVATEEIVRRAGVTRGALYHHFRSKEDLFRAVVEDLETQTTAIVADAAMNAGGVWEGMVAGCNAFLDACLDEGVQRICLLDAPSVLGVEAWREIETRYGLAITQMALEAAMNDGLIPTQPSATLAHMLLGALNEGALLIARAPDRVAARAEVGAVVERLLDGMRSSA
jgi:AcrR family transcriptional regulator